MSKSNESSGIEEKDHRAVIANGAMMGSRLRPARFAAKKRRMGSMGFDLPGERAIETIISGNDLPSSSSLRISPSKVEMQDQNSDDANDFRDSI